MDPMKSELILDDRARNTHVGHQKLVERIQEVVHFVLPPYATLVVVNEGDDELLRLDGWTVWRFPQTEDGLPVDRSPANDAAVITRLEALRVQGGDFLVFPHTAFGWLEHSVEFKQYLECQYRTVVYEPQTCLIFALQEPEDTAPLRNHGAPDGLPLPPPEMMYLVAGVYNSGRFYWGGVLGAKCIKGVLNKNGLDIREFHSLLDFGCGCGRIMRHWKILDGPKLYGTDYNPYLIGWCQQAFPFATFTTNGLATQLAYEDHQFDFVYTISIFTHLDEALQAFWMAELTRVLKLGGFLLLTVHGTTRVHELTPEQRQQFASGELVVSGSEGAGSNSCRAYHPEPYVRRVLARELTIIDFLPGGAKDANQDLFLLRKTIAEEGRR